MANQTTAKRKKESVHISKAIDKSMDGLKIVSDEEFEQQQSLEGRKMDAANSVVRIPAKYREARYDNIIDEDDAVAVAKEYGSGGKGWLFIYGQSGTAKTMLASIIGRHFIIKHSIVVEWVNAVELISDLKSTWGNNSNVSESEIINRYSRPGLLVIDDLGAEISDDHAVGYVYMILNRRSERKHPTIITSNLSIEDISESSIRIADRILRETDGGRRIHMDKGSYYLR